jgi:dCMP deaminase
MTWDSDIPPEALVNFIPVQSKLGWDEDFMFPATIASFKSKDPNTKVGCVFVDKNNHQITMGYNGTVSGIDESRIPWGNDRSVPLEYQKYGYVIHAEANAISHRNNAELQGSRGYITLFPCNECAKLIATHRVGEIIYLSDKYRDTAEIRIAKRIFDLSGVKYRQLALAAPLIDELQAYMKGLLRDL